MDAVAKTIQRKVRRMSDLISRKKAFSYFVTLWECIGTIMDRDEWKDVCRTTANEIPSAQPELDEWCYDCKEYDAEKHSCPRWNRVIRNTLKDAQPEIIRCKDCKEWYMDADAGSACKYTNMYQPADGFCNWAERRNNG